MIVSIPDLCLLLRMHILYLTPYNHDREPRDFKPTTMADTSVTIVDSGTCRLSLIFPFILVKFSWGLKQMPGKYGSNMPMLCDFLTKLLTSYRIFLPGNRFMYIARRRSNKAVDMFCACLMYALKSRMLQKMKQIFFFDRLQGIRRKK